MPSEYRASGTDRCPYCLIYTHRRILNPGAEVKDTRLGPKFIPHIPGCPGAGATSFDGAAERDRYEQAHIGPRGQHTPAGFMNMPIPPDSFDQSFTDEISPDPLLPEEHPVTGAYAGKPTISPDNREELVTVLRDGFNWTVRHDDIRGLVYTSPDRTTDAVFDDINDHDLTVTRYAPSPATTGPWDELWKVSMTASTPTRVMLAVAMGA